MGRELKWSRLVCGLALVSAASLLGGGCFSGSDRDDDEDGGGGSGGLGSGGTTSQKVCETATDCSAPTVCDLTLGRCVECLDDGDCVAGMCSAGRCVADGSGGAPDSAGGAPNTGGSSGSGGTSSGGSGGSSTTGCGNDVIDDLEDEDSATCTGGVWFFWSYNSSTLLSMDGTPDPYPLSPVRDESEFGMRTENNVDTEGAIGFSFDGEVDVNNPVDVSSYTGIQFWAKSSVSKSITVQIHCGATENSLYGGSCSEVVAATDCEANGYPVQIGTSWNQHQVPFGALAGGVGSNGASAAFDATTATSVHFRALVPYTFLIDDVEFY